MASAAQCDACGEENPSDSAFCLLCGNYLGWDVASSTAPPSPLVPDEPSPPSVPFESRAAAPIESPPRTAQTASSATSPAPGPRVHHDPAPPASARKCPQCGHNNDAGRRFCGRCGHLLVPAATSTATAGRERDAQSRRWRWQRDPRERAARREYRRALPRLYRWRRVIISVLVLVLLGVIASFLTGDPVEAVKRKWYALTDAVAPVDIGRVSSRRASSEIPGSAPEHAVDGQSDTAWSTSWQSTGSSRGCAPAPDTAVLRLSWNGRRELRRIRVRVGLEEGQTERFQQYVPSVLGVRYGEAGCVRVELDDVAGWQERPLVLGELVDAVTITLVEASEPARDPFVPVASVRDVELLARPR